MRRSSVFVSVFLLLILFSLPVYAQYGKNSVIWEKTEWHFYQSEHFDYYITMDVKEDVIQPHFNSLVEHLEASYENLSSSLGQDLKRRPLVIVTRTHSQFEALPIGDPFMSEGVGAYAMPRGSRLLPGSELLLVVKPDFLPVLNRTIYTHELTHIFQFDMVGGNMLSRAMNSGPEPWLYEATAEYKANRFAPYTRDDIRKMTQRVAAANIKNPQIGGLPTLEMCQEGQANPYAECEMVFEFLDARYGPKKVDEFIVNLFKNRRLNFMGLLEEISKGEFSSREAFDRAHRDYWTSRYSEDSLKRPQPYNDTLSVKGRQVLKRPNVFPFMSPVVSHDGYIAFLTYNRKYGIVVATAKNLPREDPPFIPREKRKKQWMFGQKTISEVQEVNILTGFVPPKPYEYIVSQEMETWPFNGSDLDWWQDHDWVEMIKYAKEKINLEKKKYVQLEDEAKSEKKVFNLEQVSREIAKAEETLAELYKTRNVNLIAFFARYNRDHALFILDVNAKKLSKPIEIPLDQGFSPKFSSDGRTIYFSAAKNIDRDIYSIDLKTHETKNLTQGGVFNSAPAISPDGHYLAYVSFVGDFQKIFILDTTTGTKSQLTYGRYNDNSPSWSSDGSRLVYTSDEKDNIWNLYTLDLGSLAVKQWTDFYGGVFMPVFVPGENDRVVNSVFFETDQYHNFIFPNFKLFDDVLKEPLRTENVQDKDSNLNMQLAFRPETTVGREIDQRQLDHPQEPPSRWQFHGSNVSLGTSTYWGAFAFSQVMVQDLLAHRTHSGLFASNGDFKYYDYTYIDQSQRWAKALNFNYSQYPLYYVYYNFQGQQPQYPSADPKNTSNQTILNNTWQQELSATLFTQYPFNKWERVELGIRPHKLNYLIPFEISSDDRPNVPPIDLQFYDYFKNAGGKSNLGLTAAYVHDTVLYNRDAGPLNGTALRGQIEFGLPLDKVSPSYTSASVDARWYHQLAGSALVAARFAGMSSSRPNGDFILLGGTDTLTAYPYFSVAGNQVAYGRGELRIPFADLILGGVVPVGIRGTVFGDAAKLKFTESVFPAQTEWSYGFSLQTNLFLPMSFEWARTKFAPNNWTFNFRIGVWGF